MIGYLSEGESGTGFNIATTAAVMNVACTPLAPTVHSVCVDSWYNMSGDRCHQASKPPQTQINTCIRLHTPLFTDMYAHTDYGGQS